MKTFLALALGLAGTAFTLAVPTLPVAAQGSDRLVTVFGTDPCPRDTICVRAPENERYRIPQELRGEDGEAAAARWGDRAKSLEYVGASGTMSCSPTGPGGASGCYRELANKARAERAARGDKPAVEF
ncbi:hypothetical protein ACFB49_18410 [Sphingomonas sp. DBB INV C78]|uniref:hypothetical protein n=1 Tax=Sphingomonas sp. DBB INV C78 TaxID=3349434 RepID=UPI0036D2630E